MSEFTDDWREDLRIVAEKSGVSLVRFNDDEWSQLKQSRFGGREFTIARHHEAFEGIKARSLCLVAGREGGDLFQLYVGVLSSKQAITTLETRIKIRRLQLISPHSESEFAEITGLENRGIITESEIVGRARWSLYRKELFGAEGLDQAVGKQEGGSGPCNVL